MVFPAVSRDYIIDLYESYLRDPKSVDASWRPYFDELWGRVPSVQPGSKDATLEVAAARLLDAYRTRGHMIAELDPLMMWRRPVPPELEPSFHGVDEGGMDIEIATPAEAKALKSTIRGLVSRLSEIYAGPIGFDCAHVDDPAARKWIYAVAESDMGAPTSDQRVEAANNIIAASEFERFFGRRFPGKKRFGADGAEAFIPWFEAVLARSSEHGVRDVIIGGTARGRLNVMANVIKKPLTAILYEFKGGRPFPADVKAAGDVPYHFGYVGERTFDGNRMSVTYCHNPSHLEAIDGVALGRVRARQDAFPTQEEGIRRVLCLQVHTDAAFAGQGLVSEVLQLSQLPAYRIGGSIHIVVNNQVGFTTDPSNGRTSIYCTDIARSVGAPVLHVNADDVDAVIRVANLAADYRHLFKSDVVVDLVCYRRHGHNELDEPTFTQPLMYRKIAQHPEVRERYIEQLVGEGLFSRDQVSDIAQRCFEDLDAAYRSLDTYRPNRVDALDRSGKQPVSPSTSKDNGRVQTGLDLQTLRRLGEALTSAPNGSSINEKISKQLAERGAAIKAGTGITWALGEALALASIACDGFHIRFSGQDTPRGAFSQRHFVLVDQKTGATLEPFNRIQSGQGRCEIIGSPLSEYSVLGFEYGYSLDAPNAFNVWEAQFGDFANVAQVIFDQFISSGEDKWLDSSNLTIMLPHGLEGQGPDHSSGRIERFLQMCADGNMVVANCSTPANLFHLLRRQAHALVRKPLIMFTPKSLLRHRAAVSDLSEFGPGMHFKAVVGNITPAHAVSRVILCSGKIAYDLEGALMASGRSDVAVLRLEQLYPFPGESLQKELARYPGASVLWCQEEPENMGAWSYIDRKLEAVLRMIGNGCTWPHCVSRPANASTAIGTTDEHMSDQNKLIASAIGLTEVWNNIDSKTAKGTM